MTAAPLSLTRHTSWCFFFVCAIFSFGCSKKIAISAPVGENPFVEIRELIRLDENVDLPQDQIAIKSGDGFHVGLALRVLPDHPAEYKGVEVSPRSLWVCECCLYRQEDTPEDERTLHMGATPLKNSQERQFRLKPRVYSQEVLSDPNFSFQPKNLSSLKSKEEGNLPYWSYIPGTLDIHQKYVFEIRLYPCFKNLSAVRSEEGPMLIVHRALINVLPP